MKITKGNLLLILIVILFVGILIVVTLGSKDSEYNQLSRRLNAFENSVPDSVRTPFVNKKYDEAKSALSLFVSKYQSYTNVFSSPDDKIKFLKADYTSISNQTKLKSIPQDLMIQWSKYYSVIDYECIQQFSPAEVIDQFKDLFVDKLQTVKETN